MGTRQRWGDGRWLAQESLKNYLRRALFLVNAFGKMKVLRANKKLKQLGNGMAVLQLWKTEKTFINEYKPKGIEKEIIESFLEWVARRDENNSVIDIPGFIIR